MWDDKTWTYIQAIPSDAPDDYKQYALKSAKEEVGRKLYEILEKTRLPAVVDLFEKIQTFEKKEYRIWSPFDQKYIDIAKEYGLDKLLIKILITPVQYQHVTFAREELGGFFYAPRFGFWMRLKWLLRWVLKGESVK